MSFSVFKYKNNSKLNDIRLGGNNFDKNYINEFYPTLLLNVKKDNIIKGELSIDLEPFTAEAIQAKKDLVEIYQWKIK